MAKLYPISPPSLFPPLVTPPRVQPPIVRPPKLTGSNYNYASPGSNYYNWYRTKYNINKSNEYVNDLGDIVLGDLFRGTKELQNTLKKYGHEEAIGDPIRSRVLGFLDATDDRFLRPFREEDSLKVAGEKMLINSLETVGNSMDILSNPVKALLGAGGGDRWDDFLRSMGWKEGEYRENYNWDTDIDNGVLKFLVDLGLEVVSDPLTILSIGGGLIKNSAEKTVLESSKVSFKNVVDDVAVQFRHLKSEDDIIQSLARFGITDDDTLAKRLLEIVDKYPRALESSANVRVEKVKKVLEDAKKAVVRANKPELTARYNDLLTMLDNDSLLNTAFYQRITKELEALADSANFKQYYSAAKFLDNVKKADNAITTASIGMVPHLAGSVYAGKQVINKVVKPAISQLYLQKESYKRLIKLQQDVRRKTYDYVKEYAKRNNKRKEFEFFNNRFNLEEIYERLIDYVRTSPFEIRKSEDNLRSALEKKAYDLIYKDNKFLKRMDKLVPEYREFLTKLSKADYDALPDTAKILVDDVRAFGMLEAGLRQEINRIAANAEDLAQEIIKTREEEYLTLLRIMKANPTYKVYIAIDEMLTNIAKQAEIDINDIDALKRVLATITASDNDPLRAILEQLGIVESNYIDILDDYLKVKELRLKTQRLYKPSFKKTKYLEGIKEKSNNLKLEYVNLKKSNAPKDEVQKAYRAYKFSSSTKSLERYNEYIKANNEQEAALKHLKENQFLSFSNFLEKSGFISGESAAVIQTKRVEQGINNVNKALNELQRKDLASEFKSKDKIKSAEELKRMAAEGKTFQTIQYNKTYSMLKFAESAIESTEELFPNFYGNKYKYLRDFKKWAATIKNLDANTGKKLEQTLLTFYTSYVQTNAFLRYFMGEMNLGIIPEEYHSRFRLLLHDTIQRLSNTRQLGAGANSITDKLVNEMYGFLEIIARKQDIADTESYINLISNEVIKPQVQRYLKEITRLKTDVNKEFRGRINKTIPFYKIIDRDTVNAMSTIGPALSEAIQNKLPNVTKTAMYETLDVISDLSKLVPTVDPITLRTALNIKDDIAAKLPQNATAMQLIEEINSHNDKSWLDNVKKTSELITRENNKFKTTYFTPEEVKDISGYWAWALARNTDLGTYNWLNEKYWTDRLHLNKIFNKIPVNQTYDALEFAHDVEQSFKAVMTLDKSNIGFNKQINEYFASLYDFMLSEDNLSSIQNNKFFFPEFEYFRIANAGEELDEQAKRAVMHYLDEKHHDFFEGLKELKNKVDYDYQRINKKAQSAKDLNDKIKTEMQKQSDLLSFLTANSEKVGLDSALDLEQDADLTKLYRSLDEEQYVASMDMLATGTKGVNGDILHGMRRDISDKVKGITQDKSNKYTTTMYNAYAVGVQHLKPKELKKYIAGVNNEYQYIVVNTSFKPTEDELKAFHKEGISITPLENNRNKLYAYLIQNEQIVEQPTQKEFNTLIGKIGTFDGPLIDVIKKYRDYLPYATSTTDNALDMSGLYQFYTGHTLNRNVMDALMDSNAIKTNNVVNKIEEDLYMHKADFVHMIDANDYNYIVSMLMDKLSPEDMNSAFRQQSYIKNVAKGFTQSVKHKDNAYKALDLFFNDDSMTIFHSNAIISKLNSSKHQRELFFKNNNEPIVYTVKFGNEPVQLEKQVVPIVLVQNKNGDPELHRIFINNEKVYQQFLEKGGIFVEPEVYKFMINNVNKVNATGVRKILYQVLKPLYAMAYLTSPGFLLRNALDTLLVKNSMSADNLTDIPKMIKSEAQAAHELKTYKQCWTEIYDTAVKKAEKLGKDVSRVTPNFYDINSVYQTWDTPTKLTFLKVTMWKDTSAAADLSSEVLELFGKGKLEEDALAKVINRISELPPMHWVTDINSNIEQTGRLGLYNYLVNYKGMNPNNALDQVIKTHFDYQTKDMGMEYLRDFFMFETFPINNTLYYLDIGLRKNPEILKLLLDVEEQSWNTAGLTWDDVKNNQLLRNQVLMGNIKIGDYILKTGSSLMDFLNIVGTPLDSVKERGNPLVRAVTQRDLRQADPFMAYPNRIRQIKKFIDTKGEEGSILPSVYAKYVNNAKKYKRARTRTNYVKWTKYPKIKKPHKTYLRNYRFYTKPYYFKRPNTLAWATSNSRWNIRPIYKKPRGARYYIRRYIGNPEYLTKFGPEDI